MRRINSASYSRNWDNARVTDMEIDVLSGPRFEYEEPEPARMPMTAPLRLGAHLVGDGADFLVLAPHASAVTLCLFFGDDDESS